MSKTATNQATQRSQNAFSQGVFDKIGNYVYRLIDPRNDQTFYVGKGQGNRVFEHVNWAAKETKVQPSTSDEDTTQRSQKHEIINEITDAGYQVEHIIHRHNIPDAAIYHVEAALIDAYEGLSNIQGGYLSQENGPMSVEEIEDKYALPELEWSPKEKLVLININRLEDRTKPEVIYNQVRLAWRISKARAEAADYVLAVVRGVVVGAFVADEWREATHEHFPDRISHDTETPDRKGFTGHIAPDEIWERFVGARGKRITNPNMLHVQFPIRYWPR